MRLNLKRIAFRRQTLVILTIVFPLIAGCFNKPRPEYAGGKSSQTKPDTLSQQAEQPSATPSVSRDTASSIPRGEGSLTITPRQPELTVRRKEATLCTLVVHNNGTSPARHLLFRPATSDVTGLDGMTSPSEFEVQPGDFVEKECQIIASTAIDRSEPYHITICLNYEPSVCVTLNVIVEPRGIEEPAPPKDVIMLK